MASPLQDIFKSQSIAKVKEMRACPEKRGFGDLLEMFKKDASQQVEEKRKILVTNCEIIATKEYLEEKTARGKIK